MPRIDKADPAPPPDAFALERSLRYTRDKSYKNHPLKEGDIVSVRMTTDVSMVPGVVRPWPCPTLSSATFRAYSTGTLLA